MQGVQEEPAVSIGPALRSCCITLTSLVIELLSAPLCN